MLHHEESLPNSISWNLEMIQPVRILNILTKWQPPGVPVLTSGISREFTQSLRFNGSLGEIA